MIDATKTDTLTEVWVECDCCRLRMFYGFAPVSREEVESSFKRDGWKFSADGKVTCEFCAAKAEAATAEEAS